MVDRPHLRLAPVDSSASRRQRRRPPPLPEVDPSLHGQALLDQLAAIALRRREDEGEELIFRVNLRGKPNLDDENWGRANIRLLAEEGEHALIAFAPDPRMTGLMSRASLYQAGTPPGQANPSYDGFFRAIDGFEELTATDRIGPRLRDAGYREVEDIPSGGEFWIDVRLWPQATPGLAEDAARAMREEFSHRLVTPTDELVTADVTLFRVKVSGEVLRGLTGTARIQLLDLPPSPDRVSAELLDTALGAIGDIAPPPVNAPSITVLDSGLTAGHPLIQSALGEAMSMLVGDASAADALGHGTFVGGIALYGDVRDAITKGAFVPAATLLSGRVVDSHGEFENEKLVPHQMSEAIRYFQREYGCRIFNISLGDRTRPYTGNGKMGPWASILDTLARELNILIVVAAGNYDPPPSLSPIEVLAQFPGYLLAPEAAVLEPSNGANVLTVGSLAGADQLLPGHANVVHVQPIAGALEPSPFTRSGPVDGRMKPDVCEIGGNAAFDGGLLAITQPVSLRVISLSHQPIQRLFTSRTGTSHAAPLVSHYAARILHEYPDASANLVRALIAAASDVPAAAASRLATAGPDAVARLCGHGKPDPTRAIESSANRVWGFADRTIGMDEFDIFEIPVPTEWYETPGRRSLRVTLAYDPPVRESRIDYAGCRMTFWISQHPLDELRQAFAVPPTPDSSEGGDVDAGTGEPSTGTQPTPSDVSATLHPTVQTRSRSTLQRAEKIWQKRELKAHRPWYLIVRAERTWAPIEERQRYAVVMEMRHEADIDLYAQVAQRVQVPQRVQLRG